MQKHVEKLACTEISPKDAFHYVVPVRCDRNSAHLIFVTSVSQLHYDLLSLGNRHELIIIIIIIIWFGDTVTVTHPTNCNTNSKVRAMSA